jgi:hypothetical protein
MITFRWVLHCAYEESLTKENSDLGGRRVWLVWVDIMNCQPTALGILVLGEFNNPQNSGSIWGGVV